MFLLVLFCFLFAGKNKRRYVEQLFLLMVACLYVCLCVCVSQFCVSLKQVVTFFNRVIFPKIASSCNEIMVHVILKSKDGERFKSRNNQMCFSVAIKWNSIAFLCLNFYCRHMLFQSHFLQWETKNCSDILVQRRQIQQL